MFGLTKPPTNLEKYMERVYYNVDNANQSNRHQI